jgi:hypothetical protein
VYEQIASRTQPGFYHSKKLNLMVQIVAVEHALPSSDDWEFIGSDIGLTPSQAMHKLLEKHPEIEPAKIQFTTK